MKVAFNMGGHVHHQDGTMQVSPLSVFNEVNLAMAEF